MLRPVFRCEPSLDRGVFTIALDPEEAQIVLQRAWATLDGLRYRVSLKGCDGLVQGDGRIQVRCELDEGDFLTPREVFV